MNNGFKWLAWAFIYMAFFALIGYAVYYTKSGWALWALILMPSVSSKNNDGDINL